MRASCAPRWPRISTSPTSSRTEQIPASLLQRAPLPVGVLGGFTSRAGGHSRGPYATLNLGLHVGDDPGDVAANRALLAAELGAAVLYLDQVHSARVVTVTRADTDGPAPTADAAVTAEPGLALAIMTADCAPVLLADPAAGVIGAAHAGRAGLLAGILPATVAAMTRLGASAPAITAVIGPTICGRCYEVPEPMAQAAADTLPACRAVSWDGTPAIDIRAGACSQLTAAGVGTVRLAGGCTREDDSCFSHRRSGPTGRMAGVVTLVNTVTHEADRATRRAPWLPAPGGSTTVEDGSFPTP